VTVSLQGRRHPKASKLACRNQHSQNERHLLMIHDLMQPDAALSSRLEAGL
jgi:hypothetical protein